MNNEQFEYLISKLDFPGIKILLFFIQLWILFSTVFIAITLIRIHVAVRDLMQVIKELDKKSKGY